MREVREKAKKKFKRYFDWKPYTKTIKNWRIANFDTSIFFIRRFNSYWYLRV